MSPSVISGNRSLPLHILWAKTFHRLITVSQRNTVIHGVQTNGPSDGSDRFRQFRALPIGVLRDKSTRILDGPARSTLVAAMDSQTVEILGRNWLVNRLVEDGLEVARPERDHGVDLIVYLDLEASGTFVARPIQLKAATTASFAIDRKYERIRDLLIAYVWLAEDAGFALSYPEAVAVGDEMGYTATGSWLDGGKYSTTTPSQRLRELLTPYRMESGDWRRCLLT